MSTTDVAENTSKIIAAEEEKGERLGRDLIKVPPAKFKDLPHQHQRFWVFAHLVFKRSALLLMGKRHPSDGHFYLAKSHPLYVAEYAEESGWGESESESEESESEESESEEEESEEESEEEESDEEEEEEEDEPKSKRIKEE